MKAMILAAGRGERLRPLTDHIPKPLIQVGDKPLIAYHLINLAKIGITEVVINISYQAEKIKTTLGKGQQFGINIHYSYEPIALETAGGICQALSLLGPEPFLVISADIWTSYPLDKLTMPLNQLAHLVLVPNPTYHPKGDFTCENSILDLEGNIKYTFGNIGIYHPVLFADCKPGRLKLVDVLNPAIVNKKITGEVYTGAWFNIGTIEQLNILKQIF